MLGDRYLSLLNRVTRENALLKLALVCLTLIAFFQYRQSSECRAQATTVLLPPNATEKMVVSAQNADLAYLRQMSRYVVALALTYTPSTAQNQFSELLGLYDAAAYASARDTLEKMAEIIKTTNLTQTFHLLEKIRVEEDVLVLRGMMLQTINNEVQPPTTSEYRVRYKIEAGRFRILELWRYEKN